MFNCPAYKRYAPHLLVTALLCYSHFINAEELSPSVNEQPSIIELQKQIKQLKNTISNQSATTEIMLQRLQALEKKALNQATEAPIDTAKNRVDEKQQNAELVKKIEAERAENARLIEAAFEQKLISTGGLLMQPGKFSYEASFSYAHSSEDRIIVDGFTLLPVLIIGDIVSEKIRREIVTFTNTFRVGLPKDFQFEIRVPYGYENQRTTSGDGQQEEIHTSGLGDISLSLSHQIIKSHSFWPDTLVGAGWKSTTGQDPYRLTNSDELALGTGFQSANISLTTVTVSDPLAFYSGIAYTETIEDRKKIGTVQPGSSAQLHAGVSMAINLDTSMSLGLNLGYIDETKFEGKDIPGSDYTTSILSIGLSRAMSNKASVEFDVGIGLTRDAPDLHLTVGLPIRLN